MFLRTFESKGLAHFSYMVGDGESAAVIDPRRDVDVYLAAAEAEGVRITHVFETHRNEDYVIGSTALAEATGAAVYHGHTDLHPFGYGHTAREGEVFSFGNVRLRVLETPGHTLDSLSLVLADAGYDADDALAVFTGDALFIGGVGRSDFYPDRAEEVAGLLYDSLFEKLLPLGDQCIVHPAHGAGSVCGAGLADRRFSTIGYERAHNPALRVADRAAFIRMKLGEHHYQPPYFKRMELYNQHGAPVLERLPIPAPISPATLKTALAGGAQLLDTRPAEAFAGAHIPGSFAIPLDMIAAWAGWFLAYDKDLYLVVEDREEIEGIVRALHRLGFDRIQGYLKGGMSAWETSGNDFDTISPVHASELPARGARAGDILLDVRSLDEYETEHLPNSRHLYAGQAAEKAGELPKDARITTFCGSGKRALVAAAALRWAGRTHVEVCFGSMQAYKALGLKTTAG